MIRPAWQKGLVLLVVLLMISPVIGSLAADTISLVVVIIVVVLLAAFVLKARPDEAGDERTGHSVWDVIPSWQYTGRHIESGGLSREEQERALREIQDEAEEITQRDAE